MEFQPQYILLYMAPIFFLCVFWEWRVLLKRKDEFPETARYSLKDTISNAFLAGFHEVGDALAAVFVVSIYYSLFDFSLFKIPNTWWAFILIFVLQDFCYYWFHRASHRIRWMWAAHVVHHSSENMNLSTAFRQSFLYPVAGMWVFWLPLVIIGFHPMTVVASVMCSLAYQFFIHTQVVRKLPKPIEAIFNTPSHHRVHHGRNPEYIDKNYAGTLIIWDKLFGTFVEERDDVPVEFGITRQIHSHDPIELTLHEWRDMFADAFDNSKSFKHGIKHFWMPPEWQPEESNPKTIVSAEETIL